MNKFTLKNDAKLLLFSLLIATIHVTSFAQCIRTTPWINVASNNSGQLQNIGDCSFTNSEYNTLTGLIVGGSYQFISRTGVTYGQGTDNFVTITDDTNAVIGFGTSPLTLTVTSSTVRLHHSINAACDGAAACNNSQFQYFINCGFPNGLTASAFTTTSATISWTAPTNAPSEGYQYYFSTSNVPPIETTTPSGATSAGVTTTNLSSLLVGTQYYFWLKSNCGSETSVWSPSGTFATVCNSTVVPYIQDFESATSPMLPTCTSAVNAGTGNVWTVVDSPGQAGFTSKTLRYAYNGTNAANTWFFTQGIVLTAGTSYRISYNYGNNTTAFEENLKVGYGTNASPVDMTSILATHEGINTSAIQFNQVDFIPTTSGTYYFGFQAYSIADQFYLYVDNISINVTPGCNAPINLAASNVTNTGASLSWSSIPSSTNYEYVLNNLATAPTGAGSSQLPNSFTAGSLTPLTQYYFHVRNNCSGTFSAWTTVSFTTLANPPANDNCANANVLTFDDSFCNGTNTNGTNVGSTNSGIANPTCFVYGENDVWFSFVVPAGVGTINVSTDFAGGTLVDTEIALYSGSCGTLNFVACDQDSGITTLSNGFSFNSLITNAAVTAGQTYYVRVSGYSANNVGTFCLRASTNTLATNSFDINNFNYYPNPVKDVLNLSYIQTISKVQINNLLGQEVLSKTINANDSQIDMSILATGTYLVSVTSEGLTKTIKVVKE